MLLYYLNPNSPRNELPTSLSLPEISIVRKNGLKKGGTSAPSISVFCFSRAALAADDSLETPAAACCACVIQIDSKNCSGQLTGLPGCFFRASSKSVNASMISPLCSCIPVNT